jgi:hypothetical protein
MTDGQARVLLLLIFLGLLEVAANPSVKKWFVDAYHSIGVGIQPKQQ